MGLITVHGLGAVDIRTLVGFKYYYYYSVTECNPVPVHLPPFYCPCTLRLLMEMRML